MWHERRLDWLNHWAFSVGVDVCSSPVDTLLFFFLVLLFIKEALPKVLRGPVPMFYHSPCASHGRQPSNTFAASCDRSSSSAGVSPCK